MSFLRMAVSAGLLTVALSFGATAQPQPPTRPGATAPQTPQAQVPTPAQPVPGPKRFQNDELAGEATRLEQRLRQELPPGPARTLAEWVREADAAQARNDWRAVSRALGAGAIVDPGSVTTLTRLSDAYARIDTRNNFEQRVEMQWRSTAAAMLAYRRAIQPETEARTLAALGAALMRRDMTRPALNAYRASIDTRDEASVRRTYEALLDQHGFRFLELAIDSDAASPRVCFQFSEQIPRRADLSPFIQQPQGLNGAVTVDGQQVCVDGLKHSERYTFTLRQGLPSTVGEVLRQPIEQVVYVRDRSPNIRFSGRNYVLPRSGQQGIPVVTVNLTEVRLEVLRYGDRSITSAVLADSFLTQLSGEDVRRLRSDEAARVYSGTLETERRLNEEVVTAIPITEAIGRLSPGVYVMVARRSDIPDDTDSWEALATQWFVVSDLGLQALSAPDGIAVSVRSLGSAAALAGVEVRLISAGNEVLATERTDANGLVRFAESVTRGVDAAAPGVVVAQTGDGDYGVLSLDQSAFDLTDRGVTGRAAPGPLDAFVHTERGVYRGGEQVHATILVRTATGAAPPSVPMTVIVERPDGLELRRLLVADAGSGGRAVSIDLPPGSATGSWKLRVHADPRRAAIGEARFLVEDYVPERIDVDLTASDRPVPPGGTIEANVAGRWLFGAPAADVAIEADVLIRASERAPRGFEGWRFGLHDEDPVDARRSIEGLGMTGRDGRASLRLPLPASPTSSRPLEARVLVRLVEAGGRPVERSLTVPIAERKRLIGVRPLFQGSMDEGGTAQFDVVMLNEDGAQAAQRLNWQLSRVETRFQWYRTDGRWIFEPVTSARRIANGSLDAPTTGAARISSRVEWGQYRLEVNTPDGRVITSMVFFAGSAGALAADAPDVLEVALDKQAYTSGDTAQVRIAARAAGRATLAIVGEKTHILRDVAIREGPNSVPVPVGADWGAGAHVLVTAFRPLDAAARRMPGRAVGIAWLAIDPAPRSLALTLTAPEVARPRRALPVSISIPNLQGDEARVVIAAVDLGILNLTRHQPPKPVDWFFGRRAFSGELRDLYGLLIDGMQGTRGRLRSGGDSGPTLEGAPPKNQPVVFFSGVVPVGADGTASVSFDLPAFAGGLRLTAVAWTATKIGEASKEIVVRDPVVAVGSAPRFLAVGDRSRLMVELQNVDGPAGDYGLSWRVAGPLELGAPSRRTVRLEPGARGQVTIPVVANALGTASIDVSIDGPNGVGTATGFIVPIRPPHGLVTRRTLRALAANGGSIDIGNDVFSEMFPGSGRVSVSVAADAAFDAPGLINRLSVYPFGCTEQIVSGAMPLLVLDRIAPGWAPREGTVEDTLRRSVERVLARQSSNGSFGLWTIGGEDLWLDAYVTDFLTRARDRGVSIPRTALDLALDRLRNKLAENREIEDGGGQGETYALYVLARNGRPVIGDLRYLADVKLDALGSPMARAHLGAGLAAMGDRSRVSIAFARAISSLSGPDADPEDRDDFGSNLRDAAALLALAGEAQADRRQITTLVREVSRIAANRNSYSTQEMVWMALASDAARTEAEGITLDVNGIVQRGAFKRSIAQADIATERLRLANTGAAPVQASVTVTGAPTTSEPAAATGGFSLQRTWHRLDGTPADLAQIRQNDRFVVVLRVTEADPKHARIMIEDRIPAGFEIENPALMEGARVRAPTFIANDEVKPENVSFRDEGVQVAFDRGENAPQTFTVAYQVRAVAPGRYAAPGAYLEDMYRPERMARTAAGVIEIGPTR
jgi:alpha-2-macroglobulin